MTDEERFLNAATRGLSRKLCLAAQAELRSHLHERVQQLVMAGESEEGARVQAMRELGPAPAIARSLRRGEQVHPALSFLALGALAALLLLPLPTLFSAQWLAGAGSSTASVAEMRAEGAMTVTEARRQLHPLGIGLTRKYGSYVLTHAGLPDAELGQGGSVMCYGPYYSDNQNTPTLPFSRTPRDFYISMPSILSCASLAGWPLDIRVGQIFLDEKPFPPMGDENFTYDTREATLGLLYAPAIAASLRQLPREVWFADMEFQTLPTIWPLYSDSPTRTVKLPIPAGTPVLVLVKSWNWVNQIPARNTPNPPAFRTFVNVADQAGQIKLPVDLAFPSKLGEGRNKTIQLHTSLATWETAPPDQNAAILLPLTERISDPVRLEPLKPLQ
ncbi:permease prefix domain 1-containing protein [Deinococcus sp. AJ005]|uniref:permease prefix domain 1-containing protein n=1 Tax=Deinococcus sp. AJ005 TaxID=2652443 RepID=UPI00125CD2B4|nr:permease prefix domain 1-containing protein [Deinococcus sp. AJ005]QFP77483.1 hypothetical protein DAAJ005_14190 [Deinococcus sp. AJ005]